MGIIDINGLYINMKLIAYSIISNMEISILRRIPILNKEYKKFMGKLYKYVSEIKDKFKPVSWVPNLKY